MGSYNTAMKIIHGSKRYEFGGEHSNELTLSGYYDGSEITFDFDSMTEETFDNLIVNDVEYSDAMRILRGSKEYQFEDTVLVVREYYTGSEVRLDLDNLTEEMVEELIPYGEFSEFDDDDEHKIRTALGGWDKSIDDDLTDDDFTDAVNDVTEKSFEEQVGYEPGSDAWYWSLQ